MQYIEVIYELYIGIMEKKMETTVVYTGYRRFRVWGPGILQKRGILDCARIIDCRSCMCENIHPRKGT